MKLIILLITIFSLKLSYSNTLNLSLIENNLIKNEISDSNCVRISFTDGTFFKGIVLALESRKMIVTDCHNNIQKYEIKYKVISNINGQSVRNFADKFNAQQVNKPNVRITENNEDTLTNKSTTGSIYLQKSGSNSISNSGKKALISKGQLVRIRKTSGLLFKGIIVDINMNEIIVRPKRGSDIKVSLNEIAVIHLLNQNEFKRGIGLIIKIVAVPYIIIAGVYTLAVTAFGSPEFGIVGGLITGGLIIIRQAGANMQGEKIRVGKTWQFIEQ